MKIIWIATLFSAAVAHGAFEIQNTPGAGQVQFEAIGRPSMLKVHGSSEPPTGSFLVDGLKVRGQVEVNLKTLDTGISLRDEHMKNKYLLVEQNPKAILKLENLTLAKNLLNASQLTLSEQAFQGLLKLHGVERPVSGRFEIKDNQTIHAQFDMKLSDFQIDIPKYMGITMADLVKVQVDLPMQPKR